MNNFYQNIFFYGINLTFILYILIFFGIGNIAPQYLDNIQYILKIYIGLILVILYNPLTYKKREFKEFDRNIVFTSGLFLILSTTIFKSIEKYLKQQTQYLINLGNSFINI